MAARDYFQQYTVPADGSILRVQPPFDARSIGIYNNGSERITVTASDGTVLTADPGTARAQPIMPGVLWEVRADAAMSGSALVDFSDERRAFLFGVPNAAPKAAAFSINNASQAVTLARPSRQLVLQLVTLVAAGVLNLTAAKDGRTVYLLTNIRVGASGAALPAWTLPIELPVGAVITVSYTGNATWYLGY